MSYIRNELVIGEYVELEAKPHKIRWLNVILISSFASFMAAACLTMRSVPEIVMDFRNYIVAAFFCRYKEGKPFSSIHIRFVDGEYICDECPLPDDHGQSFIGVKGLPKLRFVQLWDKEQREYDEETFDTLVPGKSLFAGFEW